MNDYSDAIFVLYNPKFNHIMEYWYDDTYGMYSYNVHTERGKLYSGLVGMQYLLDKKETEPDWEFIGVL